MSRQLDGDLSAPFSDNFCINLEREGGKSFVSKRQMGKIGSLLVFFFLKNSFKKDSAKSCPTLVIPWTVACQAPLSMGFSRQEYWSGLPFPAPGELTNPGIEPSSPSLQADALPTELCGKPTCHTINPLKVYISVGFSIITVVIHYHKFRTFPSPPKETFMPISHDPSFPPIGPSHQPLAATHILSIFKDVPILDISDK